MQCAMCKSEILSSFKHAIAINECPACGGQIMDEKIMALVGDLENTISSEVTSLHEDTVRQLAMVIVTKYNMVTGNSNVEQAPVNNRVIDRQPKMAPPSIAQRIAKKKGNIVNLSELDESAISEEEREKIMEEVIKKKFNMVDQNIGIDTDEDIEMMEHGSASPTSKESKESKIIANALFGNGTGDILEEERMLRLAKQQRAIGSGSGSFRRTT